MERIRENNPPRCRVLPSPSGPRPPPHDADRPVPPAAAAVCSARVLPGEPREPPCFRTTMTESLDVLAIFAHPDDAELLVGGSLIRSADRGERVGILDLTRGERGTRGSAEIRDEEAREAGEIMGIAVRRNAGFPDAGLEATNEKPGRARRPDPGAPSPCGRDPLARGTPSRPPRSRPTGPGRLVPRRAEESGRAGRGRSGR